MIVFGFSILFKASAAYKRAEASIIMEKTRIMITKTVWAGAKLGNDTNGKKRQLK